MDYKKLSLVFLLLFTWSFQGIALANSDPMYDNLLQIEESLKMAGQLPYARDSYKTIAKNLDSYKKEYSQGIHANKRLHKEVSRLSRLTRIQAKFQDCLKRFDNPNSIGNQVMQMVFSLDAGHFECEDLEHSTEKSLSDINMAVDAAVMTELHDSMIQNTMDNALSNILDMEYRIKDNNKNESQILKDAVLAACGGKQCSREDYNRLKKRAQSQLDKMKTDKTPRYSAEEAAQNMNIKIREVNDQSQFPVGINVRAQNKEQKKREAYNNYAAKFWEVSSSGIGLLLHTERLSDKIGELEEFDGNDFKPVRKGRRQGGVRGVRAFRMEKKPHLDNLTAEDISMAKKDYYWEMMLIAKDRLNDKPKYLPHGNSTSGQTNSSQKKENLEDFGRFILNNPLAAAQTLLKNLKALDIFCEAINQIEDSNESSKKVSTFRRIALGVSGGLLVGTGAILSLTGVGAAAGVPMIVTGAALTTTEVAFSAYDWHKANSAVDDIAAGIYSGNAGQQSQERLLEAKREASDALVGGAMAIGLSSVGIGALAKGVGSVAKLYEITKGSDKLKTAIEAVNKTAAMKKARKFLPETSYAEFVGMVAALPKSAATAVMSALAKAKNSEEVAVIKKSVEEALANMKCAA